MKAYLVSLRHFGGMFRPEVCSTQRLVLEILSMGSDWKSRFIRRVEPSNLPTFLNFRSKTYSIQSQKGITLRTGQDNNRVGTAVREAARCTNVLCEMESEMSAMTPKERAKETKR